MNLREDISKIKSIIFIQESIFFKRRVSFQELQEAFADALVWATKIFKKNNEIPTLDRFSNYIVTIIIDEFHPKLTEHSDEFPYDEITEYLTNFFKERIAIKYISEFT